MISIQKISVNFTGDYLFKDVSFVVGDRDRIGLVGKNGAGKSTLLKIIHRELQPESGEIVISAGHSTGYLPQEIHCRYNTTIWEETMTAFVEQRRIESKIAAITRSLIDRTDYESEEYAKLAQQLSDLNDRFHRLGGATMEGDAEKVLLGLGFHKTDFNRPMMEFSTGWQMRVSLVKILLQQPEIILLDEPTNHLDIESIQWLEEYLANYNGALILVSHDRAFLDRVTNRTVEITFGNIQDYHCSYSDYVQQRLERIEIQQNACENQQKEIARIEKFIERFRYKATKAKQVQSRIKLLNKIDRIEVDEIDSSHISFRFPPAPHSGRVTVNAENITLGYGELEVLKNIDFHLERGERVAFVGRNGEGKSTMVKAIAGELQPQKGNIQLGHQVVIGYYAQNQALMLNPNKTVFETIDEIAVGDIRPKIRSILGSFLFNTEDTEKKVAVLSGGEKSRLAIVKLLLSPFNLLILDEPTNHLDMQSKDVLKNALLQYDGSMILVSHDRDFLQGLSSKVIEFKDHRIKTYLGDIYDFLEKKKIDSFQDLQMPKKTKVNETSQPKVSTNKQNRERKKTQDSLERKRNHQIKKLEDEIADLNLQKKEIEDKLADFEHYSAEITSGELYATYEKTLKDINKKEETWMELMM